MVQRRTQRLELGRQRFALLESALRGTCGLGMHGVGLLLQRLACVREGYDHEPFVFGATFPQEKALGHELTYKWHQCAGVQCHLVGLSCRWLDGALRQQCAGHQPFERQATMNGGFSILPTGSTDPEETSST